jgi:DNA/RNA endonuclease G (NUC1)
MQNFVDIPDEHKIEAKPNKSFPVPLNEYELSLLQQVSQNLDKSQRYTSRMILVRALEIELKRYKLNLTPYFLTAQNIKIQTFVDIPDKHKIEAKPNKSFPVPLNEYELSLLQQVSQNLDKSQRYTSRMILVKALEINLKRYNFDRSLVKALIDDLIPF